MNGINVGLLNPHMAEGDAVGNDVVGMYQALSRLGCKPRIFAADGHITGIQLYPADEILKYCRSSSDLIIYHFSIGWEKGLDLLRRSNSKKVVKYHNVTPPKFFDGINADYGAVCRLGREQLHAIANLGCDLYLADSHYNSRELVEAGVDERKCLVVPPFHRIDRLSTLNEDDAVVDKYKDGRTNILSVGRITPNKRQDRLIRAFAEYVYTYDPSARLLVVGKFDARLERYNSLLRTLVQAHNLSDNVVMTGGISEEALKAYYRVADMFMMASDHEGFCVPLVESMSMKIPIVAYASSAVTETVGDAGFVWEEDSSQLMAESIRTIATDTILHARLGELGYKRFKKKYDVPVINNLFVSALATMSKDIRNTVSDIKELQGARGSFLSI